MIRLKIAIRNITRHKLRSVLSLGMIAGAVTSMIIFRGFSQFSLDSLKIIAAENQFGHMQIGKEKYWAPGAESRKSRMFNLKEIEQLKKNHPYIENISGRLSFFGLVSNGDLSIGGKIIGIDTINEPKFAKSMAIMSGAFFSSSDSHEAMIGTLLAKQMNVKTGDSITVLTNTIDGVMNAMDLVVGGIFSAGIDEIDAQVIFLPLITSQKILDTEDVDVGVVRFNLLEQSEAHANDILKDVTNISRELTKKTWRELAVLYRQVEKFYGVQNKIIEAILFALMFLGILNTVSMTVVERTGEIGTLRALGESRGDIVKQFLLESFILSIVGLILGVAISVLLIKLIHTAHIMTEMPGASIPFQIQILFLYSAVLYSSILAVSTALFATLIPAIRASKMDIVDALRKNI